MLESSEFQYEHGYKLGYVKDNKVRLLSDHVGDKSNSRSDPVAVVLTVGSVPHGTSLYWSLKMVSNLGLSHVGSILLF